MIGRILGHYRIEAKLAEGGMGVVYRAADTHLDRPVALKVLRHDVVADADRKRRFQQEARAASALNHPNIIHVYDVATDAGIDFIAMEFVEGHTLDRLIGGGLATPTLLDYAIQIADALAAAHARGIVHRDIKPSNIMLNSRNQVKVLDFGIAKLVEQAEAHSDRTRTALPRTAEGTIVGTAAYMSPEQAEGKPVGPWSDIFSFGSVVFEMASGRRAFDGDTNLAVMSAILHKEPPPLREIAPGMPLELDKIIARCLRKDPARRLQHMADVKLELDELRVETGVSGAAKAVAGRSSWRLGGAAAAAAVIVGLLGWYGGRPGDPVRPLSAQPLTTLPGMERFPSFSPDGKSVAFMWTGAKQDNPDLYVQLIGSGSPMRLTTDPRSEYNPVWSPDGKWIAFVRAERLPPSSGPVGKAEVWLIPPLAGTERKLIEFKAQSIGDPGFISWCPDSACLVVTDSPDVGKPDALYVISRESGERRQLTTPPVSSIGDSNPAISPDGRWLVFRRAAVADAGELYAMPLGSGMIMAGQPSRLTSAELDAAFPAWMPDSREVVFSSGRHLWRVNVPSKGPPVRLPYVGEDGLMPVIARTAGSDQPRLVYVQSSNDANIWRFNTLAAGAPGAVSTTMIIGSTRMDFLGDLSPDGKHVAFVSNRSGAPEIWISLIDGSNAFQLTSMGRRLTAAPRWSPDGQSIVFQSSVAGGFDIYAIPSAGGAVRRLTEHPANDHVPIFSRDGRWLYFSSLRTGTYEVWKMPAAGGEATQVTHDGGFLAFEGPDGAELYFTKLPGSGGLFRLAGGMTQRVQLFDGVIFSGAVFVVDKGVYFIEAESLRRRLRFFDFGTKKVTTVASDLGETIALLTATRDGRTVLFARVDSSVNDLMLVEGFR